MNTDLVPTSSPRPYLVPTSSRDEVNDELKFPRPLVPPLYKGTRDEDEVVRTPGRGRSTTHLVPRTRSLVESRMSDPLTQDAAAYRAEVQRLRAELAELRDGEVQR